MPHYAALRDYDLDFEGDDIRGTALLDRSGSKIGMVTDVIVEHESGDIRYLVAELHGREILIPTERVLPSEDDTLRTDLTASEAERLPAAAEAGLLHGGTGKQSESYEAPANTEFKEDYTEGAVTHRKGSDHLVTPEPGEMPVSRGNPDIDSSRLTPTRIANKFGGVGQPITAPTGIPRGSGGSSDVGTGGGFEHSPDQNDFPELSRGERWDRFARNLQDRQLERMRQSCSICAKDRAA